MVKILNSDPDYDRKQNKDGFYRLSIGEDEEKTPEVDFTLDTQKRFSSGTNLGIGGSQDTSSKDLGFFDAFSEDEMGDRSLADYTPFVTSISAASDYKDLLSTAMKLNDGDDVDTEELQKLKHFIDFNSQEKSWGYTVGSILAELPAFAGEIGAAIGLTATTGVGGAGAVGAKTAAVGAKKVAKKSLMKYITSKEFTKKLMKNIAAVEVVGSPRVFATTIGNQLNSELGIAAGENEERESVWDSFVKAHNDTMVEYGTEMMGGALGKLGGKLVGPLSKLNPLPKTVNETLLKSGVFSAIKKYNPFLSSSQIGKVLSKVGYNGVLGEMAEERVGDVLHGALYEMGIGSEEFELPSIKQLTAEMAAFSIPSVGAKAAMVTLDKSSDLYKNLFGKKETEQPSSQEQENGPVEERPIIARGEDILEDVKEYHSEKDEFIQNEIRKNNYVLQKVKLEDLDIDIKDISEKDLSDVDLETPIILDENGNILAGETIAKAARAAGKRMVNTYIAIDPKIGEKFQEQDDKKINFDAIKDYTQEQNFSFKSKYSFNEMKENIDKLPNSETVVYRGRTDDKPLEFLKKGQMIDFEHRITSASHSLQVAKDFTYRTKGPQVFEIHTKTGKDISAYSLKQDEQEVVLTGGKLRFIKSKSIKIDGKGAELLIFDHIEEKEKFQKGQEKGNLKSKFVTSEDALKQAKEIPFFNLLDVKKVKSILTPEGKEAHGSYISGLIKWTENPRETTLPHETFHAFIDLVATKKQIKEVFNEIKKEEGNKNLSDIQIEEILAERFAEWFVAKRKSPDGIIEKFLEWLRQIVLSIKGDKDIVGNLFNQVLDPNISKKIKAFKDAGGIESVRESYQSDPAAFTTKIQKALGVLNKKEISYGFLKEIVAKTKKTGLKKSETLLVENTMELTQFKDNKKIDVAEFIREMTSELLDLSVIYSDTYANYGMDNIKMDYSPSSEDAPKTILINTNFTHGVKGHFSNDFNKTTTADDLEIREIKTGSYDVEGQNQEVKKDQYYVTEKNLSEENLQEGVYAKFDSWDAAQEYINNFADRKIEQAGMLAHFRASKQEDGSYYIFEMQSDVMQKDLSKLARTNERLMDIEAEKDIDFKKIKTLKDQIENKKDVIKNREQDLTDFINKLKEGVVKLREHDSRILMSLENTYGIEQVRLDTVISDAKEKMMDRVLADVAQGKRIDTINDQENKGLVTTDERLNINIERGDITGADLIPVYEHVADKIEKEIIPEIEKGNKLPFGNTEVKKEELKDLEDELINVQIRIDSQIEYIKEKYKVEGKIFRDRARKELDQEKLDIESGAPNIDYIGLKYADVEDNVREFHQFFKELKYVLKYLKDKKGITVQSINHSLFRDVAHMLNNIKGVGRIKEGKAILELRNSNGHEWDLPKIEQDIENLIPKILNVEKFNNFRPYSNIINEDHFREVEPVIIESIEKIKNVILIGDKIKSIDKKIEKLDSEFVFTDEMKKEIALSEQFLSFKNNYHETIIKTAIRDAAINNAEVVRFPTPYTVANIEGYIETGYNENGEPQSGYDEGDISLGKTIQNHLDYQAIVTDIYDGGFTAVYSESGEIREIRESEIRDGQRDYYYDDFEYNEDIDEVKDIIWNELDEEGQGKLDDITEFSDLEQEFPDEYEKVRNEMVDKKAEDMDVSEFYEGMYGDRGYNYYDYKGETYYIDAGGENVYEESESYKVEVEKDDFTLESIQDDGHRKIAAKYGIDDEGNSGVFYKYLSKTRKDLEEVEDDNGFTWWESKITPEDTGAVEMFQTANSKVEEKDIPKQSALEVAELEMSMLQMSKELHPAKELIKWTHKRGDYKDSLGDIDFKGGHWSHYGDDIYTSAGYDSLDDARDAVAEYKDIIEREKKLKERLRRLRHQDRINKIPEDKRSDGYYVDKYFLDLYEKDVENARQFAEISPTEERLKKLSKAVDNLEDYRDYLGTKLKWEKKIGVKKNKAPIPNNIYAERLRKIDAAVKKYKIDHSLFAKMTKTVNFQLMQNESFDKWMDRFIAKAPAIKLLDMQRKRYKFLVKANILENVDGLRVAYGFPTFEKMNAKQFEILNEQLAKRYDDTFLSPAKMKALKQTIFKGAETKHELAAMVIDKVLDNKVDNLSEVTVDSLSMYMPDNILREKNVLLKYVVDITNSKLLKAEEEKIKIRDVVAELQKRAFKSTGKKWTDWIVPTMPRIFGYMESSDRRNYASLYSMTAEEVDYAEYMIRYFKGAYDYLSKVSEINLRKFYMPHTGKKFWEQAVVDKNTKAAVQSIFNQFKDDRNSGQILDEKTGQILAFNKFFRNVMQRDGTVDPSMNVGSVFLDYVDRFENKKALDDITPTIIATGDVIADFNGKTEKGLYKDETVKTFLKHFLNNKRGRTNTLGTVLPQSGFLDIGFKTMKSFFSTMVIAGSIPIQIASLGGELTLGVAPVLNSRLPKALKNYFLHKTGLKRIKAFEDETFVGQNVLEKFKDPKMTLPDKIMAGLYIGFDVSRRIANELTAAGLMTKEELNGSNPITEERKLEMINTMERFRETGLVHGNSVYGSTSIAKNALQFKTWAVKAAMRTLKTGVSISKKLRSGEIKEMNPQEVRELITSISMAFIIYSIIQASADEECKGTKFECQIQAKLANEMQSYAQAMTIFTDPKSFFLSTQWFLGTAHDVIFKMDEEYKRDGKDYEEGDNKSAVKLKRFITPKFIKQFED